ncbi:MAG: crossover junction endodeoxyribonuclease RuvC [Thermoanaerobaculia bacterium]|nr:crossover junction endodeoxyribonuclease RuvC [Thermoanaerobaculia bacterium]
MRILGIDPGSRFTGYGVLETSGSKNRLLDQGRISCRPSDPLVTRLTVLARELRQVVEAWHPDVAVLETPFQGVNPRSLIVLAQARGAILLALGDLELAVAEYTPAQIKMAVTGSGRAEKLQVSRMVGMLLTVDPKTLTADAADALAAALCHGAHYPLTQTKASQGHTRY